MSDISTLSSNGRLDATDIGYLLPSDDQLDYFVDKLCDNMPFLDISSEQYDSTKDFSVASSTGSDNCDRDEVDEQSPTKSTSPVDNCNHVKSAKYWDKRSTFNNDLNIAIMQCSGSLELLSERRKNLELLAQQQHNVANINYNFSYAPRLPDSPTRVDRLMYDISRERCRILGLTSALSNTVQSFSSKTTKDDLRKLLVSFGTSILAVMRERQSEVIFNQSKGTIGEYDSTKGVLKLVELIGEVHRMNRAVHTALWCIEIKERVGLISQRTRAGITGDVQTTITSLRQAQNLPQLQAISVQNSWQCLKATSIPPKRHAVPLSRNTIAAPSKALPQTVFLANHQQANVYQILQQHSQTQKGIQLYTQEQKAELYQHFYSSLKQSS